MVRIYFKIEGQWFLYTGNSSYSPSEDILTLSNKVQELSKENESLRDLINKIPLSFSTEKTSTEFKIKYGNTIIATIPLA